MYKCLASLSIWLAHRFEASDHILDHLITTNGLRIHKQNVIVNEVACMQLKGCNRSNVSDLLWF